MRDKLTDLLDALALLLLAGGIGCQVTGWVFALTRGSAGFTVAVIGFGLIAAALTVFSGSWLASRPAGGGESQ